MRQIEGERRRVRQSTDRQVMSARGSKPDHMHVHLSLVQVGDGLGGHALLPVREQPRAVLRLQGEREGERGRGGGQRLTETETETDIERDTSRDRLRLCGVWCWDEL